MTSKYIGVFENGQCQVLNEQLKDCQIKVDPNDVQLLYLQKLRSNIESIIPLDKRHRYCLLFGKQLISDFATWQEAKAESSKLPIQVAIYKPQQV